MGQIIKRKIQRMSLAAKLSLVMVFTMLISTFMYQGWYKPKESEAAPTSGGIAIYSNGAAVTTPVYRSYAVGTDTFGAQTNAALGVANQSHFVQKASKTRNERVAGFVTTGGVLYIQRWNGTAWSAEWNVTVGGDGVNGRRFDIVYENVSGNAMVVYSTNATGATGNEMAYRIWNGSTWSAAVNINSARLTLTGTAPIATVGAIKLAARPGSNEIALAAQSYGTATANSGQLTSFIWNGTAWGNEPATAHDTAMTTTTTTGVIAYDNFDLAYESLSGDLLVVWSRQAAAYNGYRTYSAGTWGAITARPGTARAAMNTRAYSNPNGNQIMVISPRSASATIMGHFWDGSTMGGQTTVGANGFATATTQKMWVTGAWVNVGGTDYGTAFWNTSTNGTIGHNTVSGAGAWGTAGTQVSGAGTRLEHMNADADPYGSDTIMLTWSDSAADLHARRVVVSAGPAFTYTTPTGSPLTATLTNITSQNFDFEYDNFKPFFALSSATYSQAEGNSGTATITITVNRTGDTSGTNAVNFATSDGTATTADSDYVANSGTLTFTAGVTSQTFTVTINGDTKFENNETFNVALSSPTGGAIVYSPSSAVVTITNEDTQPSVAVAAATTTAYAYDNQVVIPVSLSGASAFVPKVTYNTANGTALAGTDYTAATNQVLTFKSGQTTLYITVPITNNASINGKTFTVTLSGPTNATLGTPAATTVTINRKYSSTANTCGDCHGYPPSDGTRSGATGAVVGSHQKHIYACSTCHVTPATQTSADFGHRNGIIQMQASIAGGSYNGGTSITQVNSPKTTNTCATIACHGGNNPTPVWGVGTAGCVDCHSASLPRYMVDGNLDNVVAEFNPGGTSNGWSHKRSGSYAVTNADCIVCHIEGNSTTQKPSSFHADGNIDLRNPDGATAEEAITDNSGASFTFTKFALDLTTQRGSTITNSVADVITHKFCLKCHDSNGATNAGARVGGAATSQYKPFNTTIAGAGYVTPLSAGVAGGVVDVDTQLLTTNSSYHPVKGPKNRDFPTAAMVADPYKPAGTRGTSGTLSQGVIINCFDCHNTPGTALTNRTVSAHGNAVTLRGVATVTGTPSASNGVTLCDVCHPGHYGGAADNHGANSAFSVGTNGGMTPYVNYGCNICHGSSYTTAVIRPVRGQDMHGSNAVPTGSITSSGRWAGGGGPIAFIRNSNVFDDHSPLDVGGTVYTPVCMGGEQGINGTQDTAACDRSFEVYTVGGTY